MTLDQLYGKGSAAALRKAIGGKLRQADIESGARVYVDWSDGSSMKVDCWPKRVHYQSLVSKRNGLYTEIAKFTEDYFKPRGVELVTCQPASPESEAILRKRGGWDENMEWRL